MILITLNSWIIKTFKSRTVLAWGFSLQILMLEENLFLIKGFMLSCFTREALFLE